MIDFVEQHGVHVEARGCGPCCVGVYPFMCVQGVFRVSAAVPRVREFLARYDIDHVCYRLRLRCCFDVFLLLGILDTGSGSVAYS